MAIQLVPLKHNRPMWIEEMDEKRTKKRRLKMPSLSKYLKPQHQNKPEAKGRMEGHAEMYREKTINEEMFDDVVKRSNMILFSAKATFPFDFFPNEIIIDVTKVTVISRQFFFSGQTSSVHIRDIMDVVVETGPLFSTLVIVDMGFTQNKLKIHYMKKQDAITAREIIEGLLAASKAGVDITKIRRVEILSRLKEISRAQETPVP